MLNKMNTFRANKPASVLSRHWPACLLGAALLAACVSAPLRAQDTGGSQGSNDRQGKMPDTTRKNDSVPKGVKKTKTEKKAPTEKKGPKMGKKNSKTMMEPRRIVVVFPVDAKGSAADLSDNVTDVIKSRLQTGDKFAGISFVSSLPSVRRAVNEQSLVSTDVNPPFATRQKAQKLTMAAGYDAAVISSLDQYEYNADTQNVSMTLSIQMIDFASNPARSFAAAESVTTPAKSAKNAGDMAASGEALRALTEKMMTDILKSASGAAKPAASGTTAEGGAK